MNTLATSEFRSELKRIMEAAGQILLAAFSKPSGLSFKRDSSIVTDADRASEAFLIRELKLLVPGAAIWAEESGQEQGSSDYCWVIDPLDGTTNFVHGIPYFCISVALAYKGVPQVGAVYAPLQHEWYYAAREQGVWLNDHAVKVSSEEQLKNAVWLVGLPYAKSERFKALVDRVAVISPKSYAFRHLGAAALDCAYVACGRLDAVFLVDLAWWDIAAGLVLLQEAGAVVTDFAGKPITSSYRSFLAANSQLHERLQEILQEKAELI